MTILKCGCVVADSKNTRAVRDGFELGGYVKSPCPVHKGELNTMAKITNVKCNVGVTVNLGHFESLRLDFAADAILEDGDKAVDTMTDLRKILTLKIKEDLLASDGGKKFIR